MKRCVRTADVIRGFIFLSLGCAPVLGADRNSLRDWAIETMGTIQKDYALPGGLYSQRPGGSKPADLWGAGIMLPALNGIAAIDPSRVGAAAAYADALDKAWRTDRHGHVAYGPKFPIAERYYDDNEWVVLALVQTYELTHEQRFLGRAKTLMDFVASGETDDLGGGIWWRELRRDSKNTCSNTPAIYCALRVYQYTHDAKLLALAQRLYAWTNSHLQDADGLYFDLVKLDGSIGKMKWTYNSALMLRANCLFYKITGEKKYLREARRIARAAEAKWIRPSDGAIMDPSQFAHLFCESLLEFTDIDRDRGRIEKVRRALVFLHDHLRDSNGLYPVRWDGKAEAGDGKFILMHQASAVRGYAVAAENP